MNCASKKSNPTRAGKHQFLLASCLQSSRFCWSTERRVRTENKSREAVVGKKTNKPESRFKGKEKQWSDDMSQSGDPSVPF